MSGRDCVLGIDLGTSALKTSVYDASMRELASARASYGVVHADGRIEQDPADWERALHDATRALAAVVPPSRIAALACSTQGGTFVPLDATMRPVARALSWMDRRPLSELDIFASDPTPGASSATFRARLHEITGWEYSELLMLAKLRWLADHDPSLMRRTLFVGECASYLSALLCGRFSIDPSNAAITQLFDITAETWSADLIARARVPPESLPEVVASGTPLGTLSHAASRLTGLDAATLVVAGGHDQYCAALGAGIVEEGCLVSCGTAWVALSIGDPQAGAAGAHADRSVTLPPSIARGPHVVAGRVGYLSSVPGGGSILQSLLDAFPADAQIALESTETVELGDDCPQARVAADGSIEWRGVRSDHRAPHYVRGAMEYAASELASRVEAFARAGIAVPGLVATGGGARSDVWMRIVAARLGRTIVRPAARELATRGAALLAAAGCGLVDPDALAEHASMPPEDVERFEPGQD